MIVDLLKIKNRVHSAAAMYWSEAEASGLVAEKNSVFCYLFSGANL
jgi:hypothetical protein